MPTTHPKPELTAEQRKLRSCEIRQTAAKAAHSATDAPQTVANNDEAGHGDHYPGSFTKGLEHDHHGFVVDGYDEFVSQINQDRRSDFVSARPTLSEFPENHYTSRFKDPDNGKGTVPAWRGWESPRTGHYQDLEGPDSDAVGMAPAPAIGSEELSAEMAELYAMAILRDIPFSEIEDGTGRDANTGIDVSDVVNGLKELPMFSSGSASTTFARRRLSARFLDPSQYSIKTGETQMSPPAISTNLLFRGSGPGAKVGPYVSQFLLQGSATDADVANKHASTGDSNASRLSGFIAYGSQFIDQRSRVFLPHLDYMTDWNQWLDVQQGADMRGQHVFDKQRRFLATPRHLATYVRFDALYQAYLNACLLLLDIDYKTQAGFPEQKFAPRTGFASFGGPHILSLVTEVATRCLKLARRQKFNFHRRARPERIAGLLSVGNAVRKGALKKPDRLGDPTQEKLEEMLNTMPGMLKLVARHNAERATGQQSNAKHRTFCNKGGVGNPDWMHGKNAYNNLLLPMAFPEGSPMHPSYAAGHATVAGGCVTMLKAFFATLEDCHGEPVKARSWQSTGMPLVRAAPDGLSLEEVDAEGVTVEGELNKLAANISIARNFAGVHYYSDYYDSLRMGERVAVGILVEQMLTYDRDKVVKRFRSFDGDLIEISTEFPGFAVINGRASETAYLDWWFRPMSATSIVHASHTPRATEIA